MAYPNVVPQNFPSLASHLTAVNNDLHVADFGLFVAVQSAVVEGDILSVHDIHLDAVFSTTQEVFNSLIEGSTIAKAVRN